MSSFLNNTGLAYFWGKIKAALNGKQDTISSVAVSVNDGVGTPSATVSFANNTLDFSFTNLKGVKGDTGEQGPIGRTGEQGPKGDTGVQGDATDLAIIHSIDQTTAYNNTDVAGADAVQTTDRNLIEDEEALVGIITKLHEDKAERADIPNVDELEYLTTVAIIDVKERIMRKAQMHHIPFSVRPANPTVGTVCYDTTINKPIWYDGTRWTDALGNNV